MPLQVTNELPVAWATQATRATPPTATSLEPSLVSGKGQIRVQVMGMTPATRVPLSHRWASASKVGSSMISEDDIAHTERRRDRENRWKAHRER